MLLEEAKRQNKPYGLVFDEIAGGFAITQTFMPQSFELLPLRVTRVWVDGRPDELLRGVNLVGTPLASLETIMGAANDTDTFNGVCGAESGWVPVFGISTKSSGSAPWKQPASGKEQSKPPILPAPTLENSPAVENGAIKTRMKEVLKLKVANRICACVLASSLSLIACMPAIFAADAASNNN